MLKSVCYMWACQALFLDIKFHRACLLQCQDSLSLYAPKLEGRESKHSNFVLFRKIFVISTTEIYYSKRNFLPTDQKKTFIRRLYTETEKCSPSRSTEP
jgi:hypothetical protein